MKHFIFKEIREAGSCADYAEQIIGTPVRDGRCVAVWREGSRDSVAIDREKWFDHAANEGGGLIELCARTKFGNMESGAIQQAQEFLGEWLHLKEVQLRKASSTGRSRHDELVADGFIEKARYNYTDLNGNLIYFVCRMEHPTKKKEFVQGTPSHWGISDITPVPYNWPIIAASEWCVVVEGEKDVETLRAIGIPATTNSGGAKKWRPEFAEYLKGKKVIILPDNDDVGREHAEIVARDLYGQAASVKVVQCSKLPKGDVTDYFEKECGSWDALATVIKDAPEYEPREFSPVEAAKEANKTPFRNYTPEEKEVGKRTIRNKLPRQINTLVDDLHTRLLGAPFRVGEQMFDQDKDTGRVDYIYDAADLFSWIARKTNCTVDWTRLDGCVTKQEFFAALRAEATTYSAISHVPDYPMRDDVFYASGELPKPSEGHKAFWNFVDFFSPVDDVNRSLVAAFIMSPIFYIPRVDKPMWIIDSPDGQGSGKSTIPVMTARLYGNEGVGGEIIDVSLYDLERNYTEVVKRIISTEGRNAKIFRLDNVYGNLRSANLARLVTSTSISGRASYGRGEESRPNNLTYVVTVNSATVDTDIASRAFYIMVKKPKITINWRENILAYIEQNRKAIFSDIIDMIASHTPFGIDPATRTPEFEARVLQAACETPEQYQRVIEFLTEKKEETNTDEETARRIEEEVCQHLMEVKPLLGTPNINPKTDKIFIRSQVVESWFRGKPWIDKNPVGLIRNLAQTAMLPQVDNKVYRWPHHASEKIRRASGIMWNPNAAGDVRVIDMVNEKNFIEIAEG